MALWGSPGMLVLLAFGCVLAMASATGNTFPYCNCVRPTGPNSSPYALYEKSSTSNPDGTTTVCWALTANTKADVGKCSQFDLRKIEMDINTECRGAVKSVSFGNQTFSPSYASYPEQGALVFKITHGTGVLGKFIELVGRQTPVCITLNNFPQCNSLPKFCLNGQCNYAFFSPDNKCCPGQNLYPPPPPPSRSPPPPPTVPPPPPPKPSAGPFPYCACEQRTPFNSFSLSPSNSAPTPTVSNGLNKYCWTLSAQRYTGNATQCVNYDLKKIEWNLALPCQNAVKAITFNGQTIAASYTRYPAYKALVFKITRGGSSPLATLDDLVASSAEVCITLGAACPTLESFCKIPGFCQVAYFSQSNKCCPVQSIVAAA